MRANAARRRLWPWIVVGLLVVLVAAGYAAWRVVVGSVQGYYEDSYGAVALTEDDVGPYPPEYRLDHVPWIGASFPVCQSTVLQMIAASHGVEAPRRHFDFLMGFTYGASAVPGVGFMPVGRDPEVGLRDAAPYLGLAHRYYDTDDAALYLDALRTRLAHGYPVRVPLDAAVLYGTDGRLPHNELLVGYDEVGFTYYEPVCMSPLPCEPGTRAPGAPGLYVSDETLLKAVRAQSRLFFYPWRYAFVLFEPGPRAEDLGPIWAHNGEALTGGTWYGQRTGAAAVEALAERVEKRGARIDSEDLRLGIDIAARVRHDNAAYLREAHSGEPDVERIAALLERAAEDYARVLTALDGGIAGGDEASGVAAWLRDAAAAEREAGALMSARAQ